MIKTICVAGAGTMGSGIAFLCAQNGFNTLLFDVNQSMLGKAEVYFKETAGTLVKKQKIPEAAASNLLKKLQLTSNHEDCIADFFIEAIIENTAAKVALFNQLGKINSPAAIFASNTSSLSISGIQIETDHPERIIGMHFFNPAPVMKLVEIVAGNLTNKATIQQAQSLGEKLGKTLVLCNDSPGFIVNRVARHYYLEAMKIVELGIADIESVDAVMESMGFKMGPFKLMDLIGIDINLKVSQSIYDSFNGEERFRPSSLQVEKVGQGHFGRKTGKGFYDHPL